MPIPEPDEAEENWIVSIEDIFANSPNWSRDGRKWQGKTDRHDNIAFEIEDDSFWGHVRIRDIDSITGGESMRVQWAYPSRISGKPTNVRVLKVLSFNGKYLSEPLPNYKLEEILGKFEKSKLPPNLLDQMYQDKKNQD